VFGGRFLLQGRFDFVFRGHGSPRVQSSTFTIEREKSAELSLTTPENGSTLGNAGRQGPERSHNPSLSSSILDSAPKVLEGSSH